MLSNACPAAIPSRVSSYVGSGGFFRIKSSGLAQGQCLVAKGAASGCIAPWPWFSRRESRLAMTCSEAYRKLVRAGWKYLHNTYGATCSWRGQWFARSSQSAITASTTWALGAARRFSRRPSGM
jgi:hypothetical protein